MSELLLFFCEFIEEKVCHNFKYFIHKCLGDVVYDRYETAKIKL
jgi:hypothetical protein